MVSKIDEARIREIAQIEAEADCTIGSGGGSVAPSRSALKRRMVSSITFQ